MVLYIRANTLRISLDDFIVRMQKYGIKQVEWYRNAFSTEYQDIAKTLEYKIGLFYVQSLSSMVPVIVLDPQPGDFVLDVSAAPGSKTTQMAMHMQNTGVIVANDVSFMRLKSLGSHIDRLGIVNVCITNLDGRRYPRIAKFNKILLDAPCSSMGSRKGVCMEYSENRINSLAKLQKSLLVRAFDLLEPGGTLVYSTCTKTLMENEWVVRHLLEKRKNALLEKVELPFEFSRGESGDLSIDGNVCRFTLDEEFFVAKVKKAIDA